MKYIVYITTNVVNRKVYIGVHSCENPDVFDSYLGCGVYSNSPKTYMKGDTPFKAAVAKYGPSSFIRNTLKVFDTIEEALHLEEILVNEKFVKSKFTYNVALGGGLPPVLNKEVYVYDLHGNFIEQHFSIKEASEKYNLAQCTIRDSINKKRSSDNLYFSHTKYDKLDLSEYEYFSYRKKIDVYNTNGEFINSFNSINEACNFYNIPQWSVSESISELEPTHGYVFLESGRSFEDYINKINSYTKVNKVAIYKYDKNGILAEEFESCKECSSRGFDWGGVKKAILNRKVYKDFLWSYYKVDNLLKNPPPTEKASPKKIGKYDLEGNLIEELEISECRKQYPNCIRVCRGTRKKAYGYIWKYIY